ncbi:MAG: APC family permease [Actinobacteria bacterium]|nr:APC family permease [Actinomycetota bacterium]
MAPAAGRSGSDFDHLDERSIGLRHLVFQSLTNMAPATALALGLLVVVAFSGPALPFFILVALAICLCVASSLAQMAKHVPSAGGWYAYTARGLGPKAGFLVGWLYLLSIPAGMTLILISTSFVVQDVMTNEQRGLGWEGSPWWLWMLVAAGFMLVLAYRGIRVAMNAAIVLGVVEIALFGALAVWMVLSNSGENTLRVFDPGEALGSDFDFYFKGLVVAILVFVGFEGAAPLAEEARDPRRTVPRAIVGTTLAIGLFVIFGSYATVVGFGFDEFTDAAFAAGNPWVELGDLYWGVGWTLIFLAILNSLLGLGNAVANAASRIVYALGRNGAIPVVFSRTHATYRTPHIAIAAIVGLGTGAALLAGWKWDLLTALGVAAVALTVPSMLIYIAVCASTVAFYWRERRDEFSIWLHGFVPLTGIVGLAAVAYYQYRPLPPYPIRWSNWYVLAGLGVGALVMAWMVRRRPEALVNAGHIFIESDEGGSQSRPSTAPS